MLILSLIVIERLYLFIVWDFSFLLLASEAPRFNIQIFWQLFKRLNLKVKPNLKITKKYMRSIAQSQAQQIQGDRVLNNPEDQ